MTAPGGLEQSNFCVVPKVFELFFVTEVITDRKKDHDHFKIGKFLW